MRVAVLGAGAPAGVNALRALKQAGHDLVAVDANESHLVWCEEFAETRHMPWMTADAIDALGADVVIPQPDSLLPDFPEIRASTLLPSQKTIALCQDKRSAGWLWYIAGLRAFPAIELEEPWPDHLHLARDRLGLPLWLRARRGAGAKGAILVRSLDQAFHWIRFWQTRDSDMEWICEEYLPGRDFAWSGVYYNGELVTSFARERLEYLYPHLTPEGLTGTPTRARIVHDDRVNAVAEDAVGIIDERPHGIYSVDMKEDADGHPRPTEINAGRGFTTFGLWSLYGPNFLDLVVRLAKDGRNWWIVRPDLDEPRTRNALPNGLTLSRHIDCRHVFSRKHAPLTVCT